ncbi:Hypothetical_protein [Hexamita inflata]|uniref:Hypothetical_protein n=1 Tax=Hexamita inflata TaxID=28002 RepID=A0ABP1H9Z6_9EUKA
MEQKREIVVYYKYLLQNVSRLAGNLQWCNIWFQQRRHCIFKLTKDVSKLLKRLFNKQDQHVQPVRYVKHTQLIVGFSYVPKNETKNQTFVFSYITLMQRGCFVQANLYRNQVYSIHLLYQRSSQMSQ